MVARLATKDAETADAKMPRAGRNLLAVSANQDSSGASPVTFAPMGRRHHAAPEEFQVVPTSALAKTARLGRSTAADVGAIKDAPASAIELSALDGDSVPMGRYRSADAGVIEGVSSGAAKNSVSQDPMSPAAPGDTPLRHSPEQAAQHAALMGHFARQLWDLQSVRIQMGNRIAAMERDGLGGEWSILAASINEHTAKAETAAKHQLERIAKKHFMSDWVQLQPGIGLYGFALLLGSVGSLDRFSSYAKLWRYLGLDVVNGRKVSLKKGVKASFSTRGRMTCYQISTSIVRLGKGHWRELYDRKKAEYGETRPDWTPAHRHNAAQHYAVKMLIRAMWREWHRRQAAA